MEIRLEAHQTQGRLFLNFRSEFTMRLSLPSLQRLGVRPEWTRGLTVAYLRGAYGTRGRAPGDEQVVQDWIERHFGNHGVLVHRGETLASAWLLEYGIAVRWRSTAAGLEQRLNAAFFAHFPASTSLGRLGVQIVPLTQGAELQRWFQRALPAGSSYLDEHVPLGGLGKASDGYARGNARARRDAGPGPARSSTVDEAYRFFHLLPSAPDWVVDAVYRAAVREYHPDRGGDQEEMIKVNAMIERLRVARER